MLAPNQPNPDPAKDPLTERQRQIVQLRREGFAQFEIAEQLGITHQAVSDAIKTARKKMGVYDEYITADELHLDLERLDNCLRRNLAVVNDPKSTPGQMMQATDRVIAIQERRAKLMGMDYAAKTAPDELPTSREDLICELRGIAATLKPHLTNGDN
jgi:DNA-binding CsgD family transcriptional regulator